MTDKSHYRVVPPSPSLSATRLSVSCFLLVIMFLFISHLNSCVKDKVLRINIPMTSSMRHYLTLLELNVVNPSKAEETVDRLATRIESEPMKKWFLSAARKYILNSEKYNFPANPSHDAKDWVKNAHNSGDLFIHIDQSNLTELSHFVDWLNSINHFSNLNDNELPNDKIGQMEKNLIQISKKYAKNITAVSIETMLPKLDKWFDSVNRFNTLKSHIDDSKEVKTYPNGYRWVSVKSEKALEREGSLMDHCVGSGGYTIKVAKGITKIYSLRDPDNIPHVTIETLELRPEIIQIKGKSNSIPKQEYVPYVLDILNFIGDIAIDCKDCRNLGIEKVDGKFIQTVIPDKKKKEGEEDEILETFSDGSTLNKHKTGFDIRDSRGSEYFYTSEGRGSMYIQKDFSNVPLNIKQEWINALNTHEVRQATTEISKGIFYKNGRWSLMTDRDILSYGKTQIRYSNGCYWNNDFGDDWSFNNDEENVLMDAQANIDNGKVKFSIVSSTSDKKMLAYYANDFKRIFKKYWQTVYGY